MKTAEELRAISRSFYGKSFEDEVQRIEKGCIENAKNGLNFSIVSVPDKNIRKDMVKLFKRKGFIVRKFDCTIEIRW